MCACYREEVGATCSSGRTGDGSCTCNTYWASSDCSVECCSGHGTQPGNACSAAGDGAGACTCAAGYFNDAGAQEKCVDISLAVDMLHYATIPHALDVAVLVSGDRDFIPALVRTRQKGKRVAIASMRNLIS